MKVNKFRNQICCNKIIDLKYKKKFMTGFYTPLAWNFSHSADANFFRFSLYLF